MSNYTPLVSVIIPTYNRERFILDAIQSVLNQTYSNIEIIVVDDCSQDNTMDLVKNPTQDPRVLYIRHDENKGAPAARNTGIRVASGEYVAFLDSDDQWVPDKLTKQVRMLVEVDDVGLIYGGMLKVDESGKIVGEKKPTCRGNIFDQLLYDNLIGSTSVPLIRRSVLQDVGGFDERLKSKQDHDLWIRIAKRYKIDFVEEPLVIYRVHDNRISSNIRSKIEGTYKFIKKYKGDFNKNPHALSKQYYTIGYFYEKDGKWRVARKYYLKSLSYHLGIKNLMKFIITTVQDIF